MSADHPLRPIRPRVNDAMKRLRRLFNVIYADTGGVSSVLERLLRACSKGCCVRCSCRPSARCAASAAEQMGSTAESLECGLRTGTFASPTRPSFPPHRLPTNETDF